MRRLLLVAVLASLAAPGAGHASGCTGLYGTFRLVPGSAGAGNVVYALRLHNGGSSSCLLPGLPRARLVAAGGAAVPTKVVADPRFHATPFLLRPGRIATANARFTPNVPGPGEQSKAPCEPVAHALAVLVGGTPVSVPVLPATRVCVHGRLVFTPYR